GAVTLALVGADRLTERDPNLRVVRGHVEHALGAAAHLGAESDGCALDHARERRPGLAFDTHQRISWHQRVREDDLAELARLIHRGQELYGKSARGLGDQEQADAVLALALAG